MRGLGIVGAAAGLHPGSRALSTPARATFPSHQSEGGDGRFHRLAGWSDGRPQALGARAWRLGIAKGVRFSLAIDGAESRPKLGRNERRAPGDASGSAWDSRAPHPVFVWGDSVPWRPDEPQRGRPDFPEQTNSEASS